MIANELVNQVHVEARTICADRVFTALPDSVLRKTGGAFRRIQFCFPPVMLLRYDMDFTDTFARYHRWDGAGVSQRNIYYQSPA